VTTVLDDGRSLTAADQYFTYKIGQHDELWISVEVAGEHEFSGALEVDWVGEVRIPVTDTTVYLDGHTLAQAESAIAAALAPYYNVVPDVTVELERSRSRFFWAVGSTTIQGRFEMGLKEVRLRDALMAAGFGIDPMEMSKDYAQVAVITPDVEKPTYVVVDAGGVMFGDLRDNVRIKPGDIIYVPNTFYANMNTVLENVFMQAENAGDIYYLLKYLEDGRFEEDDGEGLTF